jgi:hypothetical protein
MSLYRLTACRSPGRGCDRGIECGETVAAAHCRLGMRKHALEEVSLLKQERLALVLHVG